MTILDANILLYSYDVRASHHLATRQWLEKLFAGPDLIGIPWLSLWAFLRISTNVRLARPLPADEAFAIIRKITAEPNVTIIEPGGRHAEILEMMVAEGQASGPLMTDAVLAALAFENGAVLASTDRGFARFKGLRWVNPLD